MNRIDRLTAILIHLQSKKVVKAQEIAERFRISLRTVYRDVKALEEAGVPLGAEAGKGYFIIDGYHLPPVMFTKEEASAMLTAEKLVEKFADYSIKEHFQTASYKIKSVLHHSQKEYLENLNDQMAIFHAPPLQRDGFPNNFISRIQNALVHKRVVQLDYYSAFNEAFTKRTVEPIGLCYYGTKWHLIAFCRLRDDYRDFRVDRIKNLVVGSEQFDTGKHPSLQTYIEQLTQTTELEPIRIRFSPCVQRFIQEEKYFYGFIEERRSETHVEMSFVNHSLSYMSRWLLAFGNKVEIISPEGLKERMKTLAGELSHHYC